MSQPTVYPESVVKVAGTRYFLMRSQQKLLGVLGNSHGFEGALDADSGALVCPLSPANAAALRERLPWLRPVTLGLRTSAGFGDRLGLATPGHVRAVEGTGIAPIFAQQSVRENARTHRSPEQVMDDAMWGVFQAGWHEPWGADADHVKTPADVDTFIRAGYTFYTVDPGEYVDNAAETDTLSTLAGKVAALPWDLLASSPEQLRAGFVGRSFDLGTLTLTFDEASVLRAATKYGRAVAHVTRMYRHLADRAGSQPFELEVSVDETDTPTSAHEHFYLAGELRRLGVRWVSLGPRFVGRFEKGVDYIGDLSALDADMAQHTAVMRHFGGYKLSLHSGSDKFSAYPAAVRHAGSLVHLKTAGTSYLEALRVLAAVEPALFREILSFSRGRYATDRATYHVSADLARVLPAEALTDADLPGLLDQFDARQVLHVTYGSVLDRFGRRLHTAVEAHEEAYTAGLEKHFRRHLEPFIQSRDERDEPG